ncbi:hypothetical protein LTR20_009275 [Exophiala xenobiotica]|nr:hypothetical protein LTR92_010413 [Exophiala xenobiotica]KAK5361695.1 hypothetical protein LTS13_009696 [Exophiala xenobiotica]KAK5448261.1 hypothetical protein LTR18_001349 [Exophiala xenobiotica]KAK5456334.1 hypothetical protein LTR20_009275 [Exophiala xenobiotica]KAK5472236.1 hypothetical protein LTR26_010362 [Exophiala xenobiotica]
MGSSDTMDAVIFKAPWKMATEKRPIPKIIEPTDALVKVSVAGICGSDLHFYRGHQKMEPDCICGHEFVGHVQEVGSSVKNFKVGQKVVCTFTITCMECWFCVHGYTNRCIRGKSFGSLGFDGGQAEYVRVPFADGTLQPAPTTVDDELLIMMCDIFPTGYYGAARAIQYFESQARELEGINSNATKQSQSHSEPQSQQQVASFEIQTLQDCVFVCLGCGPVGLCSILTCLNKQVGKVFAVDAVDDRLAEAEKWGAIPLKLGRDDIKGKILEATDGRGADAVIELVGNAAALKSAFEFVRPAGCISSIGFHQGEVPFTAFEAYAKNLNINMGRAPARRVFNDALDVLVANSDKVREFVTHKLPISEAAKGYEIFEKQLARKVVLVF